MADDAENTSPDGDGGPALPPRADEQLCRFGGWAPGLLPPIELEVAFDDLVVDATAIATGIDAGIIWVATGQGRIVTLALAAPEAPASEAWVGLQTDRVTGLAASGSLEHLFVRFEDDGRATVVDRFTLNEAGKLDLDTRVRVLNLPHAAGVRAGAGLAIDANEHLVVPLGDGAVEEEFGPADERADRRGSVLRLDVSEVSASNDAQPAADNPWPDEPRPADEAWAIGLRDPAGCAFDPETGALWCVDVGATGSEVTLTESGANLGWPSVDGPNCAIPNGCSQLDVEAPDGSYRYGDDGCGAVGGAIVRDGDLLDGVVVFGDRCSGEVWATDANRSAIVARWQAPARAFATDVDGTVWAVDAQGRVGRVRVVPTEGVFPLSFSQTGCYLDAQTVEGTPDAVPYELNAPLWTDGAIKRRHIVLPVGETIAVGDAGELEFPEGTLLLKTFSFEFVADDPESLRPVETRVMIRREFAWEFHSYQWDETGTDAELLDAGKTVTLPLDSGALAYDFPSRSECRYCHSAATPGPLGPRLDQLAREVDYGHTVADQLQAFESIGLFGSALPEITPMASPDDETAAAEARARAYLHSNCGHCHRPGGWVPPDLDMDLRFETATEQAALCDTPTQYDIPWFPYDVRVAPGDPENSAIWQRLSTRGLGQMPPIATQTIDPRATVVREWIAGLTTCPE